MSARDQIASLLWWQMPSSDNDEARAHASAMLDAFRAEVIAERDAQIIAWLGKKAGEYGTSNRENRAKAEAVGRMADKLSRGAVRPSIPTQAAADANEAQQAEPAPQCPEALYTPETDTLRRCIQSGPHDWHETERGIQWRDVMADREDPTAEPATT